MNPEPSDETLLFHSQEATLSQGGEAHGTPSDVLAWVKGLGLSGFGIQIRDLGCRSYRVFDGYNNLYGGVS